MLKGSITHLGKRHKYLLSELERACRAISSKIMWFQRRKSLLIVGAQHPHLLFCFIHISLILQPFFSVSWEKEKCFVFSFCYVLFPPPPRKKNSFRQSCDKSYINQIKQKKYFKHSKKIKRENMLFNF